MKKWVRWSGFPIIIILIGIQLIPLNRTNPSVTREVKWNAPETRALAQRACFDCHSNATTWPWYGYVAPVSFLVYNHVREGRQGLNFSAWDRPQASYDEVQRNINDGDMPRWDYLLIHSEAQLTAAEKQQLLDGLRLTYQQDPPTIRERRRGPGR